MYERDSSIIAAQRSLLHFRCLVGSVCACFFSPFILLLFNAALPLVLECLHNQIVRYFESIKTNRENLINFMLRVVLVFFIFASCTLMERDCNLSNEIRETFNPLVNTFTLLLFAANRNEKKNDQQIERKSAFSLEINNNQFFICHSQNNSHKYFD